MTALNRHFGADGIEFCAPAPSRWHLRARARTPTLVTEPLAHALLNRSIKHHLPQGADALAWHRVTNEAQMILHTHPVNAAREARGELVANSVWLWGGGTLPARCIRPPYTSAWGGGHLTRALAVAAGIAHHDLPATGVQWLAATSGADHLVVIDQLGWRRLRARRHRGLARPARRAR